MFLAHFAARKPVAEPMCNKAFPRSVKGRCKIQQTLIGNKGGVLCLAASTKGTMIASGGMDGVHVWETLTGTELERPSGTGLRGGTTAVIWVQKDDETKEALFYGTERGYLVRWERDQGSFVETRCLQTGNPSEITGITFDAASNRLAVCNRDSIVQMYIVDSSAGVKNLYAVEIDDFTPKAVAFGKLDTDMRALMAFGMYCGRIHTLEGSDGTITRTENIGGVIAHAAVNALRGIFLIDIPSEGAALYALDTYTRIKTFEVPTTKGLRPRQICFGDSQCSLVVSGSDHGSVYIFERRDGSIWDRLIIAEDTWCQTVMAAQIGDEWVIVGARSANVEKDNPIYIWARVGHGDSVVGVEEVPAEPAVDAPTRYTVVNAVLVAISLLSVYQIIRSLFFA